MPQDGQGIGIYQTRSIDFWTCGFFPGSIYALIERATRYPNSLGCGEADVKSVRRTLEALGRAWSDPIHGESRLTNTHDLGFIMMPHMRPRWELFHDEAALNTIIKAAENLHTRFNPQVAAIRSWDELVWQHAPHITGMDDNFIVIIDSLCNLDLLFYAAAHSGHAYLADAAEAHARTLIQSHLRPEPTKTRSGFSGMLYSSRHVVNFSPNTGEIIETRSAQGHDAMSTWSRGQAWGILGYAQTYQWTGQHLFLDVACGMAEYFLLCMETAPDSVEVLTESGVKAGRYVPMWDFDAPLDDTSPPLRDTSAAMAAANGMLILFQALVALGNHELGARYLGSALKIVEDTLAYSLASERVCVSMDEEGQARGVDVKNGMTFEAILKNATVSNNPLGYVKIKDHGLVYADYYLLEFGNKLLRLGLA